jgi:hypothetical protein
MPYPHSLTAGTVGSGQQREQVASLQLICGSDIKDNQAEQKAIQDTLSIITDTVLLHITH